MAGRRPRSTPAEHAAKHGARCAALGVPYTDDEIAERAPQAVQGKTEMDALVAYLQGLGTAREVRKAWHMDIERPSQRRDAAGPSLLFVGLSCVGLASAPRAPRCREAAAQLPFEGDGPTGEEQP